MKYVVFALSVAAFCIMLYQQPEKKTVEVNVVVKQGDILQDIIYELKEQYNDSRDWREIYCEAKQDNAFGRYIIPGQNIVFKMVVDK